MNLSARLATAVERAGVTGAAAGVSVAGRREVAAAGLADAESGRALTTRSRIAVASLTKPVLATAAVRAWRERGIDVDAPLIDLLPRLAPVWRASRQISLRHLLSHTSGLRPDLSPAEAASYGAGDDALGQAVRRTVQIGQTYRLGARWQYCNAGFGLAAHALGAVLGCSFEQAVADALLEPAGMVGSGFGDAEALGHHDGRPIRERYWRARRAGGGLVSTVADMLSFAEFAMADEPSLRATGVGVTPTLLGSTYGLGWNLNGWHPERRVRWHTGDWGGCHCALLVVPRQRAAVVVAVNDDAGIRLRRSFAWSELALVAGVRLPRFEALVRIGHASARVAVAAMTRPRQP